MRTLLLTGFEPFLDVLINPSGELARGLHGVRLDGGEGGPLEVCGQVLPVAFERGPRELEAALDELGEGVAAVVSLGVHRGTAFRLEERARAVFQSTQPDNDGHLGAEVRLGGPPERRTSLDLERCAQWLREAGAAEVSRSDDAGGYLCERIYRAGLDATAALEIPTLFLHVPPVEHLAVLEQERVLRGFLEALARHLAG